MRQTTTTPQLAPRATTTKSLPLLTTPHRRIKAPVSLPILQTPLDHTVVVLAAEAPNLGTHQVALQADRHLVARVAPMRRDHLAVAALLEVGLLEVNLLRLRAEVAQVLSKHTFLSK